MTNKSVWFLIAILYMFCVLICFFFYNAQARNLLKKQNIGDKVLTSCWSVN